MKQSGLEGHDLMKGRVNDLNGLYSLQGFVVG